MGSELDGQLRAIMDRLTAPQSIFERDAIERDGYQLSVFRHAPPNMRAFFDHFCSQHGSRDFIVDGDIRLTFSETYALARRAATRLIVSKGLQRGDRVGIAARNSANWIVSYMAVLIAGGCATLLNAWHTGEELAACIRLSRCKMVLADVERAARLKGIDTGARVIRFNHDNPHAALADTPAADTTPVALPHLTGDDIATILFTSGSTGMPKAAWSDHRSIVQAACNFTAQSQMLSVQLTQAGTPPADQQAALLCVPLFHVTGEIAVLLQSFMSGRKVVILPKWNAVDAMRLIEQEAVTFFVGVPLMSHEMATHAERAKFDLSSCKSFSAGGAPRPVDHVQDLVRSFPEAYPLLGYGLTETNCVGCANINQNYIAKPWSTGPVSSPLVELVIVGASGEILPPDQAGEVAIRSVCNFRGYWDDPEATAQAFRDDGFFLTGDIGYLDEDGYLFIVDRKKDIIIRGGENISCAEVEMAIYSHPAIAEACVFGLTDARYGEVPVAVFKAKDGLSVTDAELRVHLRARLATYKQPVELWEERRRLPRLGTEKVDKLALKARYSERWERARSAA